MIGTHFLGVYGIASTDLDDFASRFVGVIATLADSYGLDDWSVRPNGAAFDASNAESISLLIERGIVRREVDGGVLEGAGSTIRMHSRRRAGVVLSAHIGASVQNIENSLTLTLPSPDRAPELYGESAASTALCGIGKALTPRWGALAASSVPDGSRVADGGPVGWRTYLAGNVDLALFGSPGVQLSNCGGGVLLSVQKACIEVSLEDLMGARRIAERIWTTLRT